MNEKGYGKHARGASDPPQDKMERLAALAALQVEREQVVERLEEELREAEKSLDEIRAQLLPSLMDELKLESFSTTDGSLSIRVKEELRIQSPKEGERDAGFDWLEKNDLGGIVNRQIIVTFPLEDAERARKLARELRAKSFDTDEKRSVHASRLKSNLKQLLEAGKTVPLELFGAFRQRHSKVARRK